MSDTPYEVDQMTNPNSKDALVALCRKLQDERDEMLTKAARLIKYSELVEAGICDQDTGWYYQWGSAIEKVRNLLPSKIYNNG